MKIVIVNNGITSMAIIPETELEKLQLKDIFQGPVDSRVADKEQILDKNIADSIIITPKIAQN